MKYWIVAVCATAFALSASADVKEQAGDIEPLAVGAMVPDVNLVDLSGDEVTLHDVLDNEPAVLILFRGGWCPYCTRHLAALMDIMPVLEERGYSLYGISPDTRDSMRTAAGQKDISIELFSDASFEATKSFGLAFRLDDATLAKYDEYGISLTPDPASGDTILPVPAVFIVDAEGRVQFTYTNPDYKERLSPEKILEAVGALTAE